MDRTHASSRDRARAFATAVVDTARPFPPCDPMQFGLGEVFSIGAAAAWAVGVILYRRLGARVPPLTLNFVKNLLVLALVLPTVPLLHGLVWPDIPLRDVLLALASGAVGIAVADTLYLRALNQLGAGRMGVIGNAYSPFVILLGYLFLGERLSLMQLAGFGLVSFGVLLVARAPGSARPQPPPDACHAVEEALPSPVPGTPDDRAYPAPARADNGWRGLALGLLSILLMAVAIVMLKRVLEAQPLLWITVLRMLGAVLGLLLIAGFAGGWRQLRPAPGALDWRVLLVAAFVGQYLSMIFWLGGYKYASASVSAVLNETASVFIVVLAWLWLKEPMNRRSALGVAVTLAGVVCMLLG